MPSQTDHVYTRVRRAILSCELVPGARLSERALEAEHGASRTPVRAALMRLEREGLVAREARAWQVTPIDLNEVAALAEYREAVESAAARLACERATDAELAALVVDDVPKGDEVSGDDVLDGDEVPGDEVPGDEVSGDEEAGMRRGEDFHEGLASLGGNPFLTQAVRDAVTRMARARWLELRSAQDRDAAWREHAAIVDAVRARDPEAAASAITRHTQANLDRLLASLRSDRRALGARGLQIVGE